MGRAGKAGYVACRGVLRPISVLRGRLAAAMQAIFACFRRDPEPRSDGMERVTVSKRSVLSGQLNEMDLYIDPNALERWLASSRGERPFLKDEFPHLSDDEREFLLSGSTPDEWDKYFGDDI